MQYITTVHTTVRLVYITMITYKYNTYIQYNIKPYRHRRSTLSRIREQRTKKDRKDVLEVGGRET
jgi:hypothetical protein